MVEVNSQGSSATEADESETAESEPAGAIAP